MKFYVLDTGIHDISEWHDSKVEVDARSPGKAAEQAASDSEMDYCDGAKAEFAVASEEDGSDAEVYTVTLRIETDYRAGNGKPIVVPPPADACSQYGADVEGFHMCPSSGDLDTEDAS